MTQNGMQRMKWPVEGSDEEVQNIPVAAIERLLENNELAVHFQPIFNGQGRVYGYEALARVAGHEQINIFQLFETAREIGLLPRLDALCRENAIRQASRLGFGAGDCYLFVNVCPETLMDPAHQVGTTDEIVEAWGLTKDRIIFEITEETAVKDYALFSRAIAYYRDQGYKIAIDDFGVGYGGLKMLATIEPDFVKIDRHFVSNIDRAIVRLNLVDSIATACHRMGITVIAEGVESQADLGVVLDMNIELLQGYHLGRPAPELGNTKRVVALPGRATTTNICTGEVCFIGDITRRVEPLAPQTPMPQVRSTFMEREDVMSLPVVEGERVVGMLHRKRFFEDRLQGRWGYGSALSAYKTASELAEGFPVLLVEANATLEDVARRTRSRNFDALYDDICVSSNGKYLGTVAISALLNAITERSIALAQGSNPLSRLPGNEVIQREVEKRISQNMHFDVCYIDIDDFKPFNDHYGFERGDTVIKTLASVIETALAESTSNGFGFVGHIGGDDFIVMTRPQLSLPLIENLVARFESRRSDFHGIEDARRGSYVSCNRRGETETFPLLSLSVGIVSTEIYKFSSYAQLASLASEVKKAAKMQDGSAIVRDRRLLDGAECSAALSSPALHEVGPTASHRRAA